MIWSDVVWDVKQAVSKREFWQSIPEKCMKNGQMDATWVCALHTFAVNTGINNRNDRCEKGADS